MSKGRKTCAECGAEFGLKSKLCPECGAEYTSVFKMGTGDVLIHDVKGEEITIGVESHGGYRVRINGQGTTYHPNYSSILKHIRFARLNLKSSDLKCVDDLIEVEKEAIEFIKSVEEKVKIDQ